jgi:hypothetical protein
VGISNIEKKQQKIYNGDKEVLPNEIIQKEKG